MKLDFKTWLSEAAANNFRPQAVRTPNMRDIRIMHGPGSKFHQSVPTLPKRLGSDIMTGHGASMQYVAQKYGGAPDDNAGYRDYFGDAFETNEQDGILHFYSKFNIDSNNNDQVAEAMQSALQSILNNPQALERIRSRNADPQGGMQDYFQDEDDGSLVVDTYFKINQITPQRRLPTKAV